MLTRTLALALVSASISLSALRAAPTSAHRQGPERADVPLFTPINAASQGAVAGRPASRVPAPEDVLGFRPGDDRKLASWSQVVEYFRRLDAASDRVKLEELGRTTLGAPFVLATISAPGNPARLGEFKEIQQIGRASCRERV